MAKRICIGSSFDGRAQKVADLVEEEPRIRPATALVSAAASLSVLLRTGRFLRMPHNRQVSFIHMHKGLISQSVVRSAHAQNLKIIAWVVNDKTTMLRLRERGVDGFMTDYPRLAKETGLLS